MDSEAATDLTFAVLDGATCDLLGMLLADQSLACMVIPAQTARRVQR